MIAKQPIVVIGAGPAGCEAAYNLSRRGRSVIVLERGKLDREKPCGGGLQAAELVEFGAPPNRVIERMISGAVIHGPNGSCLRLDPKGIQAGATVKRSVYDRYLQKRAEDVGAEFRSHHNVRRLTDSSDGVLIDVLVRGEPANIEASFVVFAAGANQSLLTPLGFPAISPSRMYLAYEKWVRLDRNTITERFGDMCEFYLGSNVIDHGYGWIFPKRDVVSVGIGSTLAAVRETGLNVQSKLDNLMSGHPIVRAKIAEGEVVHTTGGLIPAEPLKQLYRNRIALIGDAGGFGNLLHGGGIYQARVSGTLCAKFVDRYLDKNDETHLAEYQRKVLQHFWQREGRWDQKLVPLLQDDDVLECTIGMADQPGSEIPRAYEVLLGSTQSHEVAYQIFKNSSLDLFYEHLRKIAAPYRPRVEEALREIRCSSPLLQNCIDHILDSDAKRFRATLVYLSFLAFSDRDWDKATPAAVAYELAHTASLIHDDICDEANKRRGKSSVHIEFGRAAAITAGDHLIFEAFHQAIRADWSSSVRASVQETLVESSLKVSQGQALDIEWSHRWEDWSVENYLRMAELKTGALIEAPLRTGGIIAGANQAHLETLRRIGKGFGVAFQIIDDASDLLMTETSSLKSLHTDIVQGKCTIVTSLLWQNCDGNRRAQLCQYAKEPARLADDVAVIRSWCLESNIVSSARCLCRSIVDRVQCDLDQLPKSNAREQLLSIKKRIDQWCSFDE